MTDKMLPLAICYDFDKTLSPDDMQSQGYIQAVGYDVGNFWKESNALATDNHMDTNLAYMYMMSRKSRGKIIFTKKTLRECGSKVKFFPGVETWFDRINKYGRSKHIEVQHYIISSGLKEMIEGTEIASNFTEIYASSFYFDSDGVAVWPAQVVNYTNKTQFLFRIEKGILDINDQEVNSFVQPEDCPIPFRNIIYIGDSDTDIPCMKLVHTKGGHSIGVYNPETKNKTKVFKMLNENRIKYYAAADYSEGSQLERLIKLIIDSTTNNEELERFHLSCVKEKAEETKNQSEEEARKEDLINLLEDSNTFANTHLIIKKLNKFTEWSDAQRAKLFKAAEENSQVSLIIEDEDIKQFFNKLSENGDRKVNF